MIDATLVTVHGFWSSPATWERLNEVWRADEELRGLRIHSFGYPSPKKPKLPFSVTRVPDYDDIAQTLATECATVLADAPDIAVVTHSQGGLILQRFLAWMVGEGRARELSRIRSVVMLACPNGGSEYLESLRRTLGYGRHPQAGRLRVLHRQVADTQRIVLQRIVNAAVVDDYQCRIPFHVYAGGSDDIVKAASAQAAFPGASTIAGNHFTILDPAAPGNRTAETIKRHMLADITATRMHPGAVPAPDNTGEPEPPAADKRTGSAKYVVNADGVQGLQIGDHNVQRNVFPEDYSNPPAVGRAEASSPDPAEGLMHRAVQENRRTAREETGGLRQQADALPTHIGQLQALVDEQDAESVRDQDRIIEALSEAVSPMTVARAMAVANMVGAFPEGEITLRASTDPMIDLTFSWQHHIGDGRFSLPGGNFLGVKAHVVADPGGGTPVIETIWLMTEKAETVIGRINGMLQQRDRWNGPKTINWGQVFRDLHRAIVLSVSYKRHDSTVDWQLHGGLYELHGQDWAITEAGIEYRPSSQVVLLEADFPERAAYPDRVGRRADLEGWPPASPAGVDLAEWQHVLWRGRWHFPVNRGPMRARPVRWPCKTFPEPKSPVTRDRWQHTSDGGQVPALMNLTHTGLFHPGYGGRQSQDVPPSIKIGILVGCQPIDLAVSGTELRARFAPFLAREPVRKLIGALTAVDGGMSWKSLAGNGPRTLEAALTADENPVEGVPAASALLMPPVAGVSLYGRNSRAATLLLYVEPRTADGQVPSPSDLAAWYARFVLTLAIPAAFAEFLSRDLGLDISDDPPVQLGIWLQSYGPLTIMLDTQGMRTLPGASPSNWFAGWAFAAPDGKPGKAVARDLLSELCEYTLHLDDFEHELDEISTIGSPAVAVNSTDQSRDMPTAADLLAERFDAEWAADIALFKKLSSQPSFQEVSDALRRGAQLGFISKYGLRARLEDTYVFLRIPHPDDWPADTIPLHLEKRFLDGVLIYKWTPGQSFVDAAYSLAKELQVTSYWEGEATYYPEATFDQYAKSLLYSVETTRKGSSEAINLIFQIVGDDWIITEREIIDKENQYQILFRRFNELDWASHVTEKGWVRRRNFLEAFETAEMLIHRRIFDGELPPDWTPPKEWPFELP